MAEGQVTDAPSPFVRYLSAKRSVDERALNRVVLEALRAHIDPAGAPLRILEVGAGNGTMVPRLVEWGLVQRADYVGLDSDGEAVADGAAAVPAWAAALGLAAAAEPGGPDTTSWRVRGDRLDLAVHMVCGDLLRFDPGAAAFDLVIANVFLDMVNVAAVLPLLWRWLRPDGHFWFTLNYDGETILEPAIAPDLEEQIFALYHRSMDERQRDGRRSGDSRCGRHLFGHLADSGAEILAAGSADSIVFPSGGRYPGDEAVFLHHIIDMIDGELRGHPQLDQAGFAAWLQERRRQIDGARLVYICHQIDFFGRVPPAARRAPGP